MSGRRHSEAAGPPESTPNLTMGAAPHTRVSNANLDAPDSGNSGVAGRDEQRTSTPAAQTVGTKQTEPSSSDELSTTHQNSTETSSDSGKASQLRSTLAIGQLIASNRPTAGSRLIASELRQLSKTLQEETTSLRKEISNLSSKLATSLKTVLEEDREQRNLTAAANQNRRPMFSHMTRRRFPVYRRPRRISLQLASKSLVNAATNTSPTIARSPTSQSPTSPSALKIPSAALSSTAKETNSNAGVAQKQTALKLSQFASKSSGALKNLHMAFKNAWLPIDRRAASFDGEADTDSTDTTPSSSP